MTNITGKLYAIDSNGRTPAAAFYIQDGENKFKPDWQEVTMERVRELKSQYREYLSAEDYGVYFYDLEAQIEAGKDGAIRTRAQRETPGAPWLSGAELDDMINQRGIWAE